MELLKNIIFFIESSFELKVSGVCIIVIFLFYLYWKFRIKRWRKILKKSVDYHIFHLTSLSKDSSINEKSRELAHSLLWGAAKQLPLDLAVGDGRGALLRSFRGSKTALNTCGEVYYQCVMNFKSIDKIILKINNTLLSTFYRIYLLESCFSLAAVLYMDFTLLFYMILKPESGTGRLYLEMRIVGRKP